MKIGKEPSKPANLRSTDFFKKVQDIEIRRGLKIGIYGEPETGKSFFGDTCLPKPVYVIDSELAAVKLAKQHFPQEDIRICEVKVISEETMQPDPIKSMYELENAIVALAKVEQGSIVIDNVTDYWGYLNAWIESTAIRRTKSGQPLRFEWGRANERYRYFIMRLLTMPLTVVLIAQSKHAFSSKGKELSVTVPRWQKQTGYWVDIILNTTKTFTQGAWSYKAIIEKCRFQRAFNKTITDCTYPKLVRALKEDLKVSVNIW